ncbi:MAG TPA: RDD family protein, partial [Acidimicrobiales bacterium]|nr:RDD family protein [Acidimicrobiales bacterium]
LDVHADFTVHRSNGTIDHRHITISVLALLLTVVVVLTYTTLLIGGPRGQTVGMMAVGVRAVDRDGLGPVPSPRALGRSVFEQVLRAPAFVGLAAPGLLLLLVVWILDMLFPLWDAQHQTLHDKVADTVVLRVRSMG